MVEHIDSTSWTGDTSHRATSFTPEARADIGKILRWVAVFVGIGMVAVGIAKGVM